MIQKLSLDELSVCSFVEQMDVEEQVALKGGGIIGKIVDAISKVINNWTVDNLLNEARSLLDSLMGSISSASNSGALVFDKDDKGAMIFVPGEGTITITHGSGSFSLDTKSTK